MYNYNNALTAGMNVMDWTNLPGSVACSDPHYRGNCYRGHREKIPVQRCF